MLPALSVHKIESDTESISNNSATFLWNPYGFSGPQERTFDITFIKNVLL